MRFRLVLPFVVDGCQPRHFAAADLGGEVAHQVGALLQRQLCRRRHYQFVDDAGVFALSALLAVEPQAPLAAGGMCSARVSLQALRRKI